MGVKEGEGTAISGTVTFRTKVISPETSPGVIGRRIVFDGEFFWDNVERCIHGISTGSSNCDFCQQTVGEPPEEEPGEAICGKLATAKFVIQGKTLYCCANHALWCQKVYSTLGVSVTPQFVVFSGKVCTQRTGEGFENG